MSMQRVITSALRTIAGLIVAGVIFAIFMLVVIAILGPKIGAIIVAEITLGVVAIACFYQSVTKTDGRTVYMTLGIVCLLALWLGLIWFWAQWLLSTDGLI